MEGRFFVTSSCTAELTAEFWCWDTWYNALRATASGTRESACSRRYVLKRKEPYTVAAAAKAMGCDLRDLSEDASGDAAVVLRLSRLP